MQCPINLLAIDQGMLTVVRLLEEGVIRINLSSISVFKGAYAC